MHFFVSAPIYIVSFLVVLTIVVFVHEMGHFWVARMNGVRVEVFSIGFGPELFGWSDRRRTRWKVCALPLGGYVKMFGDANAVSAPGNALVAMTPEERAVAFQHKRLGQRAAIVAAGPLANIVLTILVFAGMYSIVGQPFAPAVVSQVDPGSAAARAGFAAGDRIVKINGAQIDRFEQVQQIVQDRLGEPLTVLVQRGESTVTLNATPSVIDETDNFGHSYRIGRLGLRSQAVEYVRLNPAVALWRAGEKTVSAAGEALAAVGQMITGARTTAELSGPLGILQLSGEMAQAGVVPTMLLLAYLSLNLGLINLFPIPVLDGGHLLFYAIEAVRRRPLGPRALDYGFRIGLTLVLMLMIFATWNDLVHRTNVIQFITGLLS